MTFDEAWKTGDENEIFRLKKGGHSPLNDDPSRVRMNGDIIVRADERGNYIHVGGVHMDDWTEIIGTREGAKRDIYVLGDSSKSKYFGDKGPEFTKEMFKRYWKGYPNMRGHRKLKGAIAKELLQEMGFS